MTNPPGSAASAAKTSTGSERFTPRERMLRALRGEPADRVPSWLMRQAGRYLPQYHEVRRNYDFLELCKTPEPAAEVSVQPIEAIGSEAVIIFNDIMLPLEHAGALVKFDEKGPIIENPVRGADDLKRLEQREVSPDEPIASTIRIARERVGDDIPVLGFIGAPWTLACYWVEGRIEKQFSRIGALRFSDPALLTELLDRITTVVTDYLRIQIEAGADAVQIFDTWGPILGQHEYARFSAPYIKRIIQAIRPLGAPIIIYVNGCAPYLDQLAGLGADCLSIDWRIDLETARGQLNPKISLQGNLDPTALLAGPEAAAQAVRNLFERFPAGPGHVFNLGHGVLQGTSPEAAKAVIEEVKKYGRYA